MRRAFAQGIPLGLHQAGNAFAAVFHQGLQLLGGEGAAFTGALHFNEVSLIVHHKIHVHLGMAVLLIAQV